MSDPWRCAPPYDILYQYYYYSTKRDRVSITSETKSHLAGQELEQWMRTHAAVRGRRKEDLMIAEKIYAAFDEVSQRNTRPRKLIADRLIELAGLGADFTVEDLWQELRQGEPRISRGPGDRAGG